MNSSVFKSLRRVQKRSKKLRCGHKKTDRVGRFEKLGCLSGLLSGANCSEEATVVDSIVIVPEGLSEFDASAENFNFLFGAGGCIGRKELGIGDWVEILIIRLPFKIGQIGRAHV